MKLSKVFFAAVAASVASRILPYLLSGVPFSCDSWGPIGNALALLKHSPVDLGSGIFDGYNNFWPANSLYAAVTAEVLGSGVMRAAGLMVPIAGALSIVAFTVLAKKLTGSSTVAYVSALLVALFFNGVMMCGGVTKECYAYYFMLSLLALPFILPRGEEISFAITATVFSVALALSHHLTLLLAVMSLGSLAALSTFNAVMRGRETTLRTAYLTALLTLIGYAYFYLFAKQGFLLTVDEGTVTSLLSYYVLFTALGVAVVRGGPSRKEPLTSKILYVLLGFAVLLGPPGVVYLISSGKLSLMQGTPQVPASFVLYSLIYSVLGVLALLGYRSARYRRALVPYLVLWLLALLSFEVFAVLVEPPGAVSLAYRTLDFLFMPLSIIASLSMLGGGARKVAAAGISAVLVLNSFMLYSTLTGSETYTGHFWLYNSQDLRLAAWINKSLTNTTFSGDVRTSYLYEGLFHIEVDVDNGFKVVNGERLHGVLITYTDMFRDGFVMGSGNIVAVNASVIEGLFVSSNLVYSDGWGAVIWARY